MPWINVAAGLLLLGWGRRLFWLLVAWLGFTFGFDLAARLMGPPNDALVLAVGVVFGILGALAALWLESVAIALAGLLGGAYVFGQIALLMQPQWALPMAIVGAIVGLMVMFSLFDTALVVLSSLIGAHLVVEALPLGAVASFFVWTALTVAGMMVQIRGPRPQYRSCPAPPHGDSRRRTA